MNLENLFSLQPLISMCRRLIGARSFPGFCRTYLPKYFTIAASSMHREIFLLLENATSGERGKRISLAAPRGHAKSTLVSLAYVLWCICIKKERFIVLGSNTASQANDLLTHIKTELESNPRLLQDFPEVAEEPGKKPRPERWREDEIVTRNGVRVIALGAEKKIRGRRYEEHRPTLMIFDDLENEEQVASAIQREKLWNWFTKAALKAGSAQTNVIVVGTILHFDSLLARLIDPKKSPGWIGKKYQAILSYATRVDLWQTWARIFNHQQEFQGKTGPEAARAFFEANEIAMLEGAKALWPEKEDYYFLMALRESEGAISFESEKQNEPINPATQLYTIEDMHFWTNQYASVAELRREIGNHGYFVGAVDPSMGVLGRNGDPSAIIALLVDRKSGIMYVTDAEIAPKTPDDIISSIIALDRQHRFVKFGVETVQYQAFLKTELIKRSRQAGRQIPAVDIPSKVNKKLRIESLQSKIKHGTIQFSRNQRTLIEQLLQFPKGAHDDGPDALEMAVSLVEQTALEPLLPVRFTRPFTLEPANPRQEAVEDLTDWLVEDEGYTFRD